MNDTSVVYEVDMAMPPALYSRERAWLRQHVNAMLQHAGFLQATVHAVELLDATDAASVQRICVQYTVASRQHLMHYLEHDAEAMRADGLAHLGEGCAFHRRLLKPEHTAIPQGL